MLVFSASRMRLTLLVLMVSITCINAKITKKSQKDVATVPEESTKPPTKKILQKPAIIAIEIIDSNENATSRTGKGRKRTIDSSLGYGYQNLFDVQQKPPKYQVYKYSQRDIPSFKSIASAPTQNYHHHHQPQQQQQHHKQSNFQITKSLQYDLGSTKPEYVPYTKQQQENIQHYYQPGTTLFSTVDQNGHVGGLSNQAPQHQGPMVPVIILRVYTNQLTQPGALHANIPQTNPYANLNSIDLQNLLAGYVQNQQGYQHNYPQQQEQQQGYHYEQPAQYQETYKQPDTELQTHENYPDDAHTKVIFHKEPIKTKKPKSSTKISASYKAPNTKTPQKFKITIPENTYSKVEVQEHTYNQEPQQQAYYYPQQEQQYYQQYQPTQQYQDAKQYIQIATYPQQQEQYMQQYQDPQYVQYQQQSADDYQQQSSQQQYEPQQYQYEQNEQQYAQPTYQAQSYQEYAQQAQQVQQAPQSYTQQDYTQQVEYTQQQQQPQYEQQSTQDYSLQKTAAEVGRDLHPKLYNYHAASAQETSESAHTPQPVRSTKTRSTKKRRVRVPLVVAPKYIDEDKKKSIEKSQ